MSSQHDLARVVELCERFEVRPLAVINKADLHRQTAQQIERWCTGHNVTMLGAIDYDEAFSRAAASGLPITETAPDSGAAQAIVQIRERLLAELA
jgi:MinD superfamily P-loop ATPase